MPDKQPSEEIMLLACRAMPCRFGVPADKTESNRRKLAIAIDALIAARVNAKLDDAIGKVRDWQLDVNPFDQICEGISELKIKEST